MGTSVIFYYSCIRMQIFHKRQGQADLIIWEMQPKNLSQAQPLLECRCKSQIKRTPINTLPSVRAIIIDAYMCCYIHINLGNNNTRWFEPSKRVGLQQLAYILLVQSNLSGCINTIFLMRHENKAHTVLLPPCPTDVLVNRNHELALATLYNSKSSF